jgi:hypothetical protein
MRCRFVTLRRLITPALRMPNTVFDDPTIPPPGRRTGDGTESILPYLVKSLATKPQVQAHPEDAQYEDSQDARPEPRPRDGRGG